MQQIVLQIGNLPLALIVVSNGMVAISPQQKFNTIFDNPENGVSAIISDENLLVGETEIEYNELLSYKEMPELLSWLQQQNLISPIS